MSDARLRVTCERAAFQPTQDVPDEVVRGDARLVAPAEIQIAAADGFGA